jgi:indole-3-glycerol phosphate synthase
MSATYLDKIVAFHRERAAADTRRRDDATKRAADAPSLARSLLARRGEGRAGVIAEIKRRSPSKGWLAPDLDAVATGLLYESSGASAISVLTDDVHFGGSLDDLTAVSARSTLPTLRKDFTVSANDVVDAALAGASAVLLIVAALDQAELKSFIDVAHDLGLDALVEVHTEDEADVALSAGARIIGVNQRDLHTFAVDTQRAARVAASLPAGIVKVAESGLRSAADVTGALNAGFDGVLVGEHFVTAPDISAAVSAFASVRREATA